MRYDRFEVTQNDQIPEDNNEEDGDAWTVAYQYQWSDRVGLAAEWLSVDSHRFGRAYFGDPQSVTEDLLQLTLKVRL